MDFFDEVQAEIVTIIVNKMMQYRLPTKCLRIVMPLKDHLCLPDYMKEKKVQLLNPY